MGFPTALGTPSNYSVVILHRAYVLLSHLVSRDKWIWKPPLARRQSRKTVKRISQSNKIGPNIFGRAHTNDASPSPSLPPPSPHRRDAEHKNRFKTCRQRSRLLFSVVILATFVRREGEAIFNALFPFDLFPFYDCLFLPKWKGFLRATLTQNL